MDWVVHKKFEGLTLQAFIKQKLGELYSGRVIKRAIDRQMCFVNGSVERFSNTVLKAGDKILFHIDFILKKSFEFELCRVLYEDTDLLVYDKPAGVTSEEIEKLSSSLSLVHRLDRDTSGVLVFAKHEKSKKMMEENFRRREVEKEYLAIVDGIPKKDKGEICNFLGAVSSYDGATIYGKVPRNKGKEAITSWELISKDKNISLLRCVPKTGRTHQIRVHLSSIGHPILGDYRYGKKFRYSKFVPRHLLHAYSIIFNGKKVKSLLSKDFLNFDFVIQSLK